MRKFTHTPLLRWLVPVIGGVVLLGGGWGVSQISAAANTGLRPRTAARLLADVQRAHLDGLSGTIVQKSDLGLPSLPDSGSAGSSDLGSLVTGSHTLKVWFSGPDKARVALEGRLSESDVVWNGTDLWTWSSRNNTATHRTVQAPEKQSDNQSMPQHVTTPQAAAKEALSAISPTTKVFTSGTARVAGRPAYQLVLEPKDSGSLIGRVEIGIDGATHVPTSVQVISRNNTTAFEVAFTHFDPTRPGNAQFRFNPPPGTKVIQKKSIGPGTETQPGPGITPQLPASASPHVVGHGWDTVVVADLGSKTPGQLLPNAQKAGGSANMLGGLLKAMPEKSGPWGTGHVFKGTIFSAVLTNDGRIAVGAVQPSRLYDALTQVGSTS